MSGAVYFVSFKLKKQASVPDFLAAAQRLNDGFISKQKGYVSWRQAVDGQTWADFLTFETMDDAKNFLKEAGNSGELAQDFYSFINLPSCKSHLFEVERSYE